MTAKRKALQKVWFARRTARDAAAGALAIADGRRVGAERARDEADAERVALAGAAPERFAEARSGSALLLYEHERRALDAHAAELKRAAAAAAREVDAHRAGLGARERALRSCERAIERIDEHHAHQERRAEQSAIDDLVGARVRREP